MKRKFWNDGPHVLSDAAIMYGFNNGLSFTENFETFVDNNLYNFCTVVINSSHVVFIGGHFTFTYSTKVFIYDFDKNQWGNLPDLPIVLDAGLYKCFSDIQFKKMGKRYRHLLYAKTISKLFQT